MNRPIKILFVVTSHGQIDATHSTGLWLEEFAVPYGEFKRAGYEIAVSSPQGGVAPIAPVSHTDPEQKGAWAEAIRLLHHTRRVDAMRVSDYDGIFICGGHGAMFDLPGNPPLQALLAEFALKGKIISAVGHGSAAFVNVKVASGRSLVYGKRVTAITDGEEREAKFDLLVPFLLETRLRLEGAIFMAQSHWTPHQERDENLITGQNPQSSRTTARTVVRILEEKINPVATTFRLTGEISRA